MIKRYGEPRTEEIVRGWVANQPILINGDAKILEAIAAGQCDVALANTYYLGASSPGRDFPVAFLGQPADDRVAREHLGRGSPP
jgi:iron(III) transport system substrate-binding protein